MSRPGRNDPCWCGSERKYKKCHLLSDDAGTTTPPAPALSQRVATRPAPTKNAHLILDEAGRQGMRAAGRFNAELMDYIRPLVLPGVRTDELDRLVHEYTLDHGHIPATLGYHDFPKSCCTSVNEVVCHGIPDGQVLREGDAINVDLTTIVDGWFGDQSETILVGETTETLRNLVSETLECLHLGIAAIKPGGRIIDIGHAIARHAHAHQYSVVRDYQGHGIGRKFHQDPGVPHFPDHELGQFVVQPGMCFTIEPMINLGSHRTVLDKHDGWTVRTADGKISAQFEHTLLMTEDGPEILTLTQNGPQRGHRF